MRVRYHVGSNGYEGSLDQFDRLLALILEATLQMAEELDNNEFRYLGDAMEVIPRTVLRQDAMSDAVATMIEAIMMYIHYEGPLTFTHQIITVAKGIIGITEMPEKQKRELLKGDKVSDHLLYYVWSAFYRANGRNY